MGITSETPRSVDGRELAGRGERRESVDQAAWLSLIAFCKPVLGPGDALVI